MKYCLIIVSLILTWVPSTSYVLGATKADCVSACTYESAVTCDAFKKHKAKLCRTKLLHKCRKSGVAACPSAPANKYPEGFPCRADVECDSGRCEGFCKGCYPGNDGTENNCGGTCATKCEDYENCGVDSDCRISGACRGFYDGSAKFCVPLSCTDGVKDGSETDVDCGGYAVTGGHDYCGGCATGQNCSGVPQSWAYYSCASGVCDLNGLCL
jgi:hypothetical protein